MVCGTMYLTRCGPAVPKDKQEKGLPPYPFRVWRTKKQSEIIWAFNEQHIRDMIAPVRPTRIERQKEKMEKITIERLGPPGAEVGRPADYEPAFKILRAWVDSEGGPPEHIRKQIREHWVDYTKIDKK